MKTVKQRFDEKWCPEPFSGCWLWTATTSRGYGQIKIAYEMMKAHRVSWEIYNGAIPTGLHVLHRCDTPSCVNPNHLWLGTIQDNMRDCLIKNRNPKGMRTGSSKLTDEKVRQILALPRTLKQGEVANSFGVTRTTVTKILQGTAWKHISARSPVV